MQKTDSIEIFLDNKLIDAPSTRRNYRLNIQTYFKCLNKNIETYFKELPNDNNLRNKILDEYDNDLRYVYKIQKNKGRPDLSMRTFFNSVKQFMITYDKGFKDLEFWDILKARTKGAEPENDEAILNKNNIREILSHSNTCSRALFTMLASSGRRIFEILALTPDDIDTSVSPTIINIKKGLNSNHTKTKMKTLCFISDEATEAYKAWMLERDAYLINSAKKIKTYEKKLDDSRVFPMSYSNALVIWERLLMRAKLIDTYIVKNKWNGRMETRVKRKHKGERLYQHPHCLRKFFRSYLGDADLAEYLMGHATLMTKTYRQMKQEDKAEKYLKLMENVTIFSSGPSSERLDDMQKQITEKDKQIKELEERIRRLESQKIQELIVDVEKLKNGKKK